MNAVVVQHPNSLAFRASPRITTEIRRLHADALWITLHKDTATGLQNFTPDLVGEFHDLVEDLQYGRSAFAGYAVVQSADSNYFSMGGDLRFFRDCIQRRDALRLRDYSMRCLDLLLSWSGKMKDTSTSIALVQGRALGGGFEMALSTDYLIAEEHSSFGFPEIMFGLFPCTGAMGLLSARIGARQAERMMTNKKIYSAIELYDMGLVDELCARGEGELAVGRFIANHASRQKARLKVQQSRYRHSSLDRAEGRRVVEDWVETAMQLSPEELRAMEMLILMQQREAAPPARRAAVA
ncbi:crotonase/enoyl-CoA hydratase family protein [Thermomonas carbonis]|uniref:Enoyl-CoA hydratase/isomerase family protein n=1 Tax=Thermomonas carbonis TaxID=1463158 RepID=A0A7G9SNZ8_9GAMM|nr:crotonase/enoyl-CoA hydratase family protein [Thermomonas carbonis]QNN69573.1 enoyl-CoA hydratase/isomerase family protein [Thermomonas carbonis]GHB93983.1 enoyl-CoA hydratase [Thermomonas carbonis]